MYYGDIEVAEQIDQNADWLNDIADKLEEIKLKNALIVGYLHT